MKEHVVEPSAFDPPDQDLYEYWAYTFEIEGRTYRARRYVDTAHEVVLEDIRRKDDRSVVDARTVASYLIANEGVTLVKGYNVSSGTYDWEIASSKP